MRIISGKHKGRIITPPRNLRARPTTDFAKENLFNVLAGLVDIEESDVLDLFAGTGSVSYEFASRGARSVTSVELNAVHYNFIRRTASEFGFDNLHPVKANVFLYLKSTSRQFDIIFSDAPYDLAGSEQVVGLVFSRGLLRGGKLPESRDVFAGTGNVSIEPRDISTDSEDISSDPGVSSDNQIDHSAETAVDISTDSEDISADCVGEVKDTPGETTSTPDTITNAPGGLLIFEHSKDLDFTRHPRFVQMRSYGSVQFSMFR